MAEAADKAAWNRTAIIVATTLNMNRPKGKPPIKPESISPYGGGANKKKGVPLTKDNFHLLKLLTPESRQ